MKLLLLESQVKFPAMTVFLMVFLLIGCQDEVERLQAKYYKAHPDERAKVIEDLAKTEDIRAVRFLANVACGQDAPVIDAAKKALLEIKNVAVEPLILSLQTNDERAITTDGCAAELLGDMGDQRAVPALISLMQQYPRYCRTAVEALGKLRDRSAVAPLLALLDKDSFAHGDVILALGKIDDRRAIDRLKKILKSEEYSLKSYAAEALGMMTDPQAAAVLYETAVNTNPDLRRIALGGLVKLKTQKAIDLMMSALHDNDPVVAEKASLLATQVPAVLDRALEILLSSDYNSAVKINVARGIGRGLRAEAALKKARDQGDVAVVAGAYHFFIWEGDPLSEKFLIAALQEFGTKEMAVDYVNCGNPKLAKAGRSWGSDHGFFVLSLPTTESRMKWGENKKR